MNLLTSYPEKNHYFLLSKNNAIQTVGIAIDCEKNSTNKTMRKIGTVFVFCELNILLPWREEKENGVTRSTPLANSMQ